MNYCFIVCDHGLGHIRRVISVCEELRGNRENSVAIYGRQEYAKKFGWTCNDFETKTTEKALINGDDISCRWHKRLPDIDSYDVVISDNLPEVLEIREDVILMGSFLWHIAIKDINTRYRRFAEQLLEKYRPIMIGSGIFACPEVKLATRFVDVGLFQRMNIPSGKKTDLLISCGLTDGCLKETMAAVEKLAKSDSCSFRRVYVEPRALPDKQPKWMYTADYSPRMFSNLAAAVVRPGVGTVSELLQAGSRIFSFYEDRNYELQYNARAIERVGYGRDCGTVDKALAAAISDFVCVQHNNPTEPSLELEGAKNTARYLESVISAKFQ